MILCDPGDSVIVTFDWSDVLPTSVTVSSATHSIDTPMTKVSESSTSTTSAVKVSGAVHGTICMVTGIATLSNGEVVNRQFPVRGWNS